MKKRLLLAGLGSSLTLLSASAFAQQSAEPVIEVGGLSFNTWQEYVQSSYFQTMNLRCGLPEIDPENEDFLPPSDCTLTRTNINPVYNPGQALFQIPVVVHIIQNTGGAGNISDAQVANQIQILNEDFLALPGSLGEPGTDCQIQFYLADRDPQGNPTNGITRSTNNTWFNDGGSYWNTLAWDTSRYLNIYTNSASGALGYVPSLPQGGIVGSNSDRVVVLWSSFGLNGPIGPPYNKGRTTTHEVGHYLGLYHTFQGGCAPASSCSTNGDRVCDTNPDGQPHFGCPNTASCGSTDPVHNYMEYTDDLCMWEFTPHQANRMRCVLTNYRSDLSRPPAQCNNAAVASRTMGNNLNVYSATPAVIGQTVTFTVDATGWQFASIFGVSQPAARPLDSQDWVLINIDSPLLINAQNLPGGPNVVYQEVVAPDPSMCGMTIYTQAKLHNAARRPFRLTNSQDLLIGN